MAFSMLVVFLVLAALYESWSIPLSVILVVPLGLIGAFAAIILRQLASDVFFQVGLITIIGLSAKNAILIVEFAKQFVEEGKDVVEAAVEAAKVRLRPILMTSLAFMLGRAMMIGYRSGFFTDADLAIALDMATTDAAAVLGREHYGMEPGDDATFVLVDADNASAAVAAPPCNRRLVQRGKIVAAPASRFETLLSSFDTSGHCS